MDERRFSSYRELLAYTEELERAGVVMAMRLLELEEYDAIAQDYTKGDNTVDCSRFITFVEENN